MRPAIVVGLAFLITVGLAFLYASSGAHAQPKTHPVAEAHELKYPEFEIVNFKVELDARASTDPFWPKYNGRGAITARVGGVYVYEDESYDVYLGFKRKNLETNAVDESFLFISDVRGLRNFDAPCVGQDRCEYSWTGIRYWNHIAADAHTLVDVCCLMKGKLKNATAK